MTPGALFYDKRFRFHDGEEGRKIFVVMGSGHGVAVVAKTTSQGGRFGDGTGCHSEHRFPYFFLPHGCSCLSKPTWVCLNEYYEFKDAELLQRHFSGEISNIGILPGTITVDMIECALQSDDISPRQAGIVRAALEMFRSSPEMLR